MKTLLAALATVFSASFLVGSQAAAFKCQLPNGKVLYQDSPCDAVPRAFTTDAAQRNSTRAAPATSKQERIRQQPVAPLTLVAFEKSAFFNRYGPTKKEPYPLNSGGINYPYSIPSGDADEPIGLELNSDPRKIAKVGIEFFGSSLRNPATFTAKREQMVRDLIASTYPDTDIQLTINVIRAEQAHNIPDDILTASPTRVGSALLRVASVATSLIIHFQR